MPIQYTDPIYATLTAELAQNVAFKQQAEAEAKNRQQMDLAAMEIQSRRELAQFEAQMRTQAAKLSQAWELEKMQRESELDFQNAQGKLQLARDAVTMKETHSKEKYMAYVDNIDQDKTLSDQERGQFKRMAYDQMVAEINLADQVYFPEKYAASRSTGGGSILDEIMDTTPQPAAAAPTIDSERVSAMREAQLELGSSASPVQLAQKIEDILLRRQVEAQTITGPGTPYADRQAQIEIEYRRQKAMQSPQPATPRPSDTAGPILRKGGFAPGEVYIPKGESKATQQMRAYQINPINIQRVQQRLDFVNDRMTKLKSYADAKELRDFVTDIEVTNAEQDTIKANQISYITSIMDDWKAKEARDRAPIIMQNMPGATPSYSSLSTLLKG